MKEEFDKKQQSAIEGLTMENKFEKLKSLHRK